MRRPLPLLFGLLAVSLTLACGRSAPPAGEREGPLRVVATTGMIGWTAQAIAGERAAVTALMGPGVDPHLYKASESDVRQLSEADLILYNGLHLEGKMGDILVKLARSRPVVAVSETVPPETLREPPEFQGQYDPHIWFDVALWARTVGPIRDAMIEIDPANAEAYRANAERVSAELAELDRWVEGKIAAIPPERRVMVTAHDAFGYFGKRYGIDVVGIQGISTLAEAGLQDIERVVDLVVERRIPALFVESSVSRRSVEAVQAAAESRGHRIAVGGELFSDAMGAAGSPEATYPGMVRHNVETVVSALGGEREDAP